jgi:7-cyano-7-deazaguanine reductase
MNTIEQLASVHLGKAGDGSVVKPYVIPDTVDPSLLVPVPRIYNRIQYNIDESRLPFVGYDSWNCYEFSTLLHNGYPISGLLKIVYPAESESIVESKSLKLYLNSYNMARIVPAGMSVRYAVEHIQAAIAKDLCAALKVNVRVRLHVQNGSLKGFAPLSNNYWHIDSVIDVTSLKFDAYVEDPSLLQVIETSPGEDTYLHTNSLRSNCRVTNQPDWGDVYVFYRGNRGVTSESFLKYIVSMRKENHFHEEIAECIYKRLWDLLEPDDLLVTCLYTRRGGIDINPIRASSKNVIDLHAFALANPDFVCEKTLRQ